MALRLGDINQPEPNLSCALTMLCAISGKTPDEIGLLMQQVCADDGRQIALRRPDYAPRDWLEAITRLGGIIVGRNEHGSKPYAQRPSIDDWINANTDAGLIVIATDDGKVGGEAHVFAIQNRTDIVDTYSNGVIIKFAGSPFAAQRVIFAYKIEDAPQPAAGNGP
jgi:hypothetical protein